MTAAPPALTTSKTRGRTIWFPPRSVQYPRRSDRHVALPPHGLATTAAALAADADSDRFVDPHGPPNVMAGPDLPIGHCRTPCTAVRRVQVDEYIGRRRVYRTFEELRRRSQTRQGDARLRHVQRHFRIRRRGDLQPGRTRAGDNPPHRPSSRNLNRNAALHSQRCRHVVSRMRFAIAWQRKDTDSHAGKRNRQPQRPSTAMPFRRCMDIRLSASLILRLKLCRKPSQSDVIRNHDVHAMRARQSFDDGGRQGRGTGHCCRCVDDHRRRGIRGHREDEPCDRFSDIRLVSATGLGRHCGTRENDEIVSDFDDECVNLRSGWTRPSEQPRSRPDLGGANQSPRSGADYPDAGRRPPGWVNDGHPPGCTAVDRPQDVVPERRHRDRPKVNQRDMVVDTLERGPFRFSIGDRTSAAT